MDTWRKFYKAILKTDNDYKPIIPRLIVGVVFLSEGIQKFLFPELVGAGRFEKIGFAEPVFLAGFVATFEMVCATFILIGLTIRLASIPLLIIMATALATTKLTILMESGFWSMAHAARTDFAMTLLLIFLIRYGAGKYSFDYCLRPNSKKNSNG